ncbi:GNAT family N-acetyltransferase [Streptomyces sp. NPDC059708]|uniref:GNAT family N-acetyltransferase n=1 Tax=Streptomyces sp. NPDC059708 TaxID=3346916 RepID=UPI0036BA35FD
MTLELVHHDHSTAKAIRQTLIDVHAEVYADQKDDPFVQRFPWFVDHWSGNPGFTCVIGYDQGEPVGYAYGAAQREGGEWWRGHTPQPAAGGRTYAVSEIMVRPRWRKTGTARRIHEALLDGRPESLAVLLVDTAHPRVQNLYETWHYTQVGTQQPFPDSPLFAVMVRTLRP